MAAPPSLPVTSRNPPPAQRTASTFTRRASCRRDQAIGRNTAAGDSGLIEPTRYVTKDFEEMTVDSVRMVQNTPGTEAPAEMNTYFPQFKAFWAEENITGTIHDIYTLHGALIRDPHIWSKHINLAL